MSRTSTSKGRGRVLQRIRIYAPENPGAMFLQGARSFVSGIFPTVQSQIARAQIHSIRRDERERVAASFAAARVKDPDRREQSFEPMFGEVAYELRVLDGDARAAGVVYDGHKLGRIHQSLLAENSLGTCHIVLTDRLVSTFSEDDLRHHLRTVVPGFPSVISVPGIVEAPSRPREYCVKRRALEMMGASQLELERLKREYDGRFIDYGDRAIAEVLKGLTLQAIMFHLTLRPFCEHKGCRLFNAHWQEELIESQISHGGLCEEHARQLRALGRNPRMQWLSGTTGI